MAITTKSWFLLSFNFFTSTVEKAKKVNKKFPDRYIGSGDIVSSVPNALANLAQAVKAIVK